MATDDIAAASGAANRNDSTPSAKSCMKEQPHTCFACEGVFYRRGKGASDAHKCCSRECGFIWQRFKAKASKPVSFRRYIPLRKPTHRICIQCSTSFEIYPFSRSLCAQCAVIIHKRNKKTWLRNSGVKAAQRKARKLKLRGITVEQVNPIKVLERDNWTCQLCGVRTPKRLRGSYHDRAPEVDHIIAVALGGEHSYRNVQCACRKCNIAKSGKAQGQMLLFG